MVSGVVSELDLSNLVMLLLQTGVSCVMILGSPMFTFMMMRAAGYYFHRIGYPEAAGFVRTTELSAEPVTQV